MRHGGKAGDAAGLWVRGRRNAGIVSRAASIAGSTVGRAAVGAGAAIDRGSTRAAIGRRAGVRRRGGRCFYRLCARGALLNAVNRRARRCSARGNGSAAAGDPSASRARVSTAAAENAPRQDETRRDFKIRRAATLRTAVRGHGGAVYASRAVERSKKTL